MGVAISTDVLCLGLTESALAGGNDANLAVSFQNGVLDLLKGCKALVARGGHHVVVLNAVLAQHFGAPGSVLEQDKRSTVKGSRNHFGDFLRTHTIRVMHHRDGYDLHERIGERAIVPHDVSERKSTDKEYQDKLKRGHLLAGSTARHAYSEDEEKITEYSSNDRQPLQITPSN